MIGQNIFLVCAFYAMCPLMVCFFQSIIDSESRVQIVFDKLVLKVRGHYDSALIKVRKYWYYILLLLEQVIRKPFSTARVKKVSMMIIIHKYTFHAVLTFKETINCISKHYI